MASEIDANLAETAKSWIGKLDAYKEQLENISLIEIYETLVGNGCGTIGRVYEIYLRCGLRLVKLWSDFIPEELKAKIRPLKPIQIIKMFDKLPYANIRVPSTSISIYGGEPISVVNLRGLQLYLMSVAVEDLGTGAEFIITVGKTSKTYTEHGLLEEFADIKYRIRKGELHRTVQSTSATEADKESILRSLNKKTAEISNLLDDLDTIINLLKHY